MKTEGKVASLVLLMTALLTGMMPSDLNGAGPRGPHFQSGGGARVIPPARVLERIGLSDTQMEQVELLQAEIEAAVEPLVQQVREMRQALKKELDQGNPSPQRVGELVISSRDLREQLRDTRQSFQQTFEALLTAEQLESLEEFRERRGRPGFFLRRGALGEEDF